MQGLVSTPLTLETDFAGVVVESGPEVRHVKPGDTVYGLVPMHSGSFAEYVVAKPNEVTHMPKSLNFVQAAMEHRMKTTAPGKVVLTVN